MDLTNEQWEHVASLVPPGKSQPWSKGRPLTPPREVFNGILWILRSGTLWKGISARYLPYRTCHRWFQDWRKQGAFERIRVTLAEDLRDRGCIDLREVFIDGTLLPKKSAAVGKTRRQRQQHYGSDG